MLNQQEIKYVLGKLVEIVGKIDDIQKEINNIGYYIADDTPCDWWGAIPTDKDET